CANTISQSSPFNNITKLIRCTHARCSLTSRAFFHKHATYKNLPCQRLWCLQDVRCILLSIRSKDRLKLLLDFLAIPPPSGGIDKLRILRKVRDQLARAQRLQP